jgi:hypothetical protein
MSFREKILIGIIGFIILAIPYNSYFPEFLVTGEYIAKIEDKFGADGVENGDNLILNEDGTFQCDSWGVGTYTIKGDEIVFK